MRVEEIRVVCVTCHVLVRGDASAPYVSHGFCDPCGRAALAAVRHEMGLPDLEVPQDPRRVG